MFLTLTLPSYGRVTKEGTPRYADYNYRRAALDALHFPKLVDRFWQNLRRAAGYQVQYFAVVEEQHRLAPHLHAAVRGAIPRALVKQVAAATYHQVWWPRHDEPLYGPENLPEWRDGRRVRRPADRRPAADLAGGPRRDSTRTPRPARHTSSGSGSSSTCRASSRPRATRTGESPT